MARSYGSGLNIIGSNPYPQARDKDPDNFLCELCDRTIGSKDWSAHKNSKKHRALEDEERRAKLKENVGPVVVDAESTGTAPEDKANEESSGGQGGRTKARTIPLYARGDDSRTCHGCGEEGHIKRDCPKSTGARDDRACYNCGLTGHIKADCTATPQARQGGGDDEQLCYNCLRPGHRKLECTNERVYKCHNCGEIGHMSKNCSKPTDWSKVQCKNCKQFGHTVKRCKAPPAEDTYGGSWNAYAESGPAATGNWVDDVTPAGGNSWVDDVTPAGGNSWDNATAGCGW